MNVFKRTITSILIIAFSVIAMHDWFIMDNLMFNLHKKHIETHSTTSGIVHENYSHQFSYSAYLDVQINKFKVIKTSYFIVDESLNYSIYSGKIWEPPKIT